VAVAFVIAIATQASGAAQTAAGWSAHSRAQGILAAARATAPVMTSGAKRRASPRACSARKAVKYYAGRIAYWRDRMGEASLKGAGQEAAVAAASTPNRRSTCPRYLAHVLQRKAYAARRAYGRYLKSRAYHWDYERWMPSWMIRLGQCEMGLDWSRRAGVYEGAFAFYTGTWDDYRLPGYPHSAADATPRQQMVVVLRIARKLGVADPWGCWRGPQHAWVRGGLPEYGFYG
jgi:hypothetical protein